MPAPRRNRGQRLAAYPRCSADRGQMTAGASGQGERTMASVLVGYATRYGSTREVAEAVTATLQGAGLSVECRMLREVKSLEAYESVVLGAPLFLFRWHKDAHRFLAKHRSALSARQVAVFVLGPTHEPRDEQEWRDARVQIEKELARYSWFKPVDLQKFGGKYDPTKLSGVVRWLAGKTPATDVRDWAAIRSWAGGLGAALQGGRRTSG